MSAGTDSAVELGWQGPSSVSNEILVLENHGRITS